MPWVCILPTPRNSAIARADFPFTATSITLTHSTKVNTFFLLEFIDAILRTVPLAAVYTGILHFCGSKFTQTCWKVYTSLQQGTCVLCCGLVLQVNGCMCAKSGGRWSCLAGSYSTWRLFCTKSFIHGILVMNTRCFLNTLFKWQFLLYVCMHGQALVVTTLIFDSFMFILVHARSQCILLSSHIQCTV